MQTKEMRNFMNEYMENLKEMYEEAGMAKS